MFEISIPLMMMSEKKKANKCVSLNLACDSKRWVFSVDFAVVAMCDVI